MTSSDYQSNRIWEIDALRGVAVVAMIVFHTGFDLAVYYGFDIDYLHGPWFVVGRSSAILFMFISGVSSHFSSRPFVRCAQIFACAMLVTMVSIPVMGDNAIVFGILHFFAAVMLLRAIINRWVRDARARNLIQLCIIPLSVVLGRLVQGIRCPLPFFIPIGIMPPGFTSYDYYPIFPWVAFFAAGALAAGLTYGAGKRPVRWNPFAKGGIGCGIFTPLCFLGRHSLAVYMIHQPLIIVVLYLLLGRGF